MRKELLIYGAVSAIAIVTAYQMLRTGELTSRSFPIAAIAALLCVNGLVYLGLRRRTAARARRNEGQ